MTRDQVIELLRAADPTSENSSASDGFPSVAALLDRIDERSTNVQTQERPISETLTRRPGRRPRWLIPALAGAAAVIIAIVVGTLVLAGGGDEPDVIEPPPTTLPEAAVPAPLEVMGRFNEAVVAGDWQALRALFADTAQLEAYSAETSETFVEPVPLVEFVPSTSHDWDGDGSVDGFDGIIEDGGREHAAGTTTYAACSLVDAVTAACELVSEGFAFAPADYKSLEWTVIIVDGLITNVREDIPANSFLYDTNLTFGYRSWVVENRPELERELFDDIVTLAISPDTVPIHRELVAEWRAQR